MHYNSFKTRFLRVMLLSLVFLLTAGQLSAKMIYFKNNSNWGNVKAHVWDGWQGDVDMTSCDNGWFKGEINDNAKQILFYTGNWESQTDDLSIPSKTDKKNAYNDGWTTYEVKIYGGLALNGTDWYTSGRALEDSDGDGTYTYTFTAISGINNYFFVTVGGSRIGDTSNATNKDMQLNTNYNWKNVGGTSAQFYIADDVKLTNGQSYTLTINTKNNTVRIDGEAAPIEKSYQIKHGWNGATDWTWKDLTSNGDGTYSITDYYGGGGCNWKEKNASNDTYIASPTLEGNPQRGDRCTFTLNPSAGTITITKLGAEAINEIYVFGSLDFDETWDDTYGAGRKMTDAGNGIFTYDFTMGFSGQTYYAFHAKTNFDNYKFLRNDTNTEVAMGGTAAYAMHSGRDNKSFYTNGFLKNGRYRITVNTNDNTIGIVLLEEPTYTPVYNTVYIFGGIADGAWDENHCSILLNDNKGIFPYTFKYQQGMDNGWAFRVQKADGTWKTVCNNSSDLTLENELDIIERDKRGDVAYYSNNMQPGHVYTVYLNTNTNKVYLREGGKNGIPVYPRGVHSETELDTYDFTANPVVYLVSNMLNNNRVTPEWQMVRDANGNYHLDGFAARTGKGTNNYRARVYTAKDEFFETAAVELDFDDNNANLSEGKLYNANVTVSDGNYTLTLTEDASAQGRMPFISLVGYAMQQDQDYKTPRAFEGHPAGVSTSKGWQEAWLQYDESGNLVTDREGNVMYTTMWPPKNPVYFTANIGGERLYTSENMTFKPVTGENGKYVGKTGADWMSELKSGEEAEAYNGLNLDANTVYYRYVVPEIWYVGSAKIWTGWNGEAINDSGWKAMWSYHRNWGYSNRKSSDTDGTKIDAETTYGVSTAEGSNGNFKFDNPTYFKTIEFFYSTEHPNTGSKIYTTLAFGNAQIEAQSHKDNGKYDFGQYKPSVKPGEGVTVASYIIRCYDAATGKLVTLNDGIVAQGNGNPTATTFQDAQSGLAEGKYYFEMEVVFNIEGTDKQRTTTVKSNPFIIHFPGVYTLEPVAQQLAQMGDNPNGYVSYSTGNETIYRVTLNEDGNIASLATVTESERADLYKNNFDKNSGIKWSDKVLVVAPVPAQFKLDAEKAEPAVSLETIGDYDVTDNGVHKTIAKRSDGSLAYVANTTNFDKKQFNAAMSYAETVDGSTYDKTTEGKAVSVEMMRPNPVAGGEATVTVEKVANTTHIIVDEVPVAAAYYKVCVELPFADANVTATADQPAYQVTVDGVSKLYTATTGDKAVTIAAVNPTQASDVKVSTLYKNASGQYTLAANIGDELSLTADNAAFTQGERSIALFKMASVKVKGEELYDNYITNLGIEQTQADKLADFNLDPEYYKFELTINDEEVPFYQYFNNVFYNVENLNNFDVKDALKVSRTSSDLAGSSASICIAPVYPVLVNATVGAKGMTQATTAAGAPALKADPTYVALYGEPAEAELLATNGDGGIVTGINGVDASKAVQSVRFVNVAGQMSDKPFEGMNIMVTTYTDGTTATAKVIK